MSAGDAFGRILDALHEAALVLLAEPARGVGIDPDLAAAVLGLTPMESRVAVMLAGGMSVREIAGAGDNMQVG